MADLTQMLIDILCPTPQAAQACQSFVSQPSHQALAPVGPIFYLVLFPSVFIIILIYLLSSRIISGHRGINLLLGITIYMFIVLSGFYSFFLFISEIWYIAIIILLGMWLIFNNFRGKNGGGAGKSGMSGIGNFMTKRAMATIKGDIGDEEKFIEDRMYLMKGMIESVRKASESGNTRDVGVLIGKFRDTKIETEAAIRRLGEIGKSGGISVDPSIKSRTKRYGDRIRNITKMMGEAQK